MIVTITSKVYYWACSFIVTATSYPKDLGTRLLSLVQVHIKF